MAGYFYNHLSTRLTNKLANKPVRRVCN